MKNFGVITIFVYLAFLIEFVLYNTFGVWGKPELMVLVIIFCNLYWGIRHSLWAAFVAGLLKGAFDIEPFGTYVLIYITAAYLTTIIRKNLYQPGSKFSRLVVALFVLLSIFMMEFVLHLRSMEIRFSEAVIFILIPTLALTMVVATFVFVLLKNIALKLKI